jgi:hypothetical protein
MAIRNRLQADLDKMPPKTWQEAYLLGDAILNQFKSQFIILENQAAHTTTRYPFANTPYPIIGNGIPSPSQAPPWATEKEDESLKDTKTKF